MSNVKFNKEDVAGLECKHVIYIPPIEDGGDDFHYIKEVVHLKDKTTVPNTRVVKNYPRPFGITKPAFRNHLQKKEWEDIDKVSWRMILSGFMP